MSDMPQVRLAHHLKALGSVRNFVCEQLVVNGYCIAQQSPIATA
jgi:hypothetical protein